jgi:hypothetical protein
MLGTQHPFPTRPDFLLQLRRVNWTRSRFGRNRWVFKDRVYERPRVDLVSLDSLDTDEDRMGNPVAGSSVDGDASGFAADMRTLDKRGRRPGRRNNWLGDEAA